MPPTPVPPFSIPAPTPTPYGYPYDPRYGATDLGTIYSNPPPQQQVPRQGGGAAGLAAPALLGAYLADSGLPEFSLGALAEPAAGFNIAGEVPIGLTAEGGFAGMGAGSAAASPWALSGVGSAGNFLLPAAGAVGALDLFANKRTGGRGAIQGALSGAAMGSYFGPWGSVIGGGIGGLSSLLNKKKKTDMENKRWKELIEQGYQFAPQGATEDTTDTWYRPDLGADFVGIDEGTGSWVNNKFAQGRNEGDLQAKDIWGYSIFPEMLGNEWMSNLSEADREAIAQRAIESGVREHHGTIDLLDPDAVRTFAQERLAANRGPVLR